jgi:hypothetical protein
MPATKRPEDHEGFLIFVNNVIVDWVSKRQPTIKYSVCYQQESSLVLDTGTYEVEFNDSEVTEYTANMIAQAMYTQYDINGSITTPQPIHRPTKGQYRNHLEGTDSTP